MKERRSAAGWAVLLLGMGLLLSLTGNSYLYARLHGPMPPLRGTYCTDASLPGGLYLILDGESRFCRYTQEEGVLDEGTFEETGEGRYALRSREGKGFCVLQDRAGVYLFDGEENTVSFLPRMGKATDRTYYVLGGHGGFPDWVRAAP